MIPKPGVTIGGIQPELIFGMMAAEQVCREFSVVFVVTSVTDGKHSPTSLHYSGNAFDMRINNMGPRTPKAVADRLRERLKTEFDVILEKDHIHVEWQPKR